MVTAIGASVGMVIDYESKKTVAPVRNERVHEICKL